MPLDRLLYFFRNEFRRISPSDPSAARETLFTSFVYALCRLRF